MGKTGKEIEVKIKIGLFGTKYLLLVNSTEHPLLKTTKAQALGMIEAKRQEVLNEAAHFDKQNARIYPILKPGDWAGIKNTVHKIMIGDERNPQLVIGYGYDLPGSFIRSF